MVQLSWSWITVIPVAICNHYPHPTLSLPVLPIHLHQPSLPVAVTAPPPPSPVTTIL